MAIYLDHASTTPLDPRVRRAMEPFLKDHFGNPGSLHSFGQKAMAAVDAARETLANLLGVEFREIIFTGSATEANNLALRGTVKAFKRKNPGIRPKILVSAVEHESVLSTAKDLRADGAEVILIKVNKYGRVDVGELRRALDERTVLVSVMYVNNEIGTVEPVPKIAEIIHAFRAVSKSVYPLFHTDAVQAFQFLPCAVKKLGIDLLTLSAHKMYGPKGIGVLCVRAGVPLLPILTGGGQEMGLRSGTENVAAIVGLARAAELTDTLRTDSNRRLRAQRARFLTGLKKAYPGMKVNGVLLSSESVCSPNIVNVYFPRHVAEEIIAWLDMRGIALASGSACHSRSPEPSHVLKAIGLSPASARHSVRFSLGRPTTPRDIDIVLRAIRELSSTR